MNPELNFFEKKFTVFSLLFFSGILALSSFFVAPDSKADAEPVYSPLDSVLSLVQLAIYGIVLFLIFARWKSSSRTAIRDPFVWLFAGIAFISFLWSDFPDWTLKKGITTLQTTSFGLYMASRFSLKEQLEMLGWALGHYRCLYFTVFRCVSWCRDRSWSQCRIFAGTLRPEKCPSSHDGSGSNRFLIACSRKSSTSLPALGWP